MSEGTKVQETEAHCAIQNVSNSALTKPEKYAVGYCKTCDTPNHEETKKDCDKCNGYLFYTQDD